MAWDEFGMGEEPRAEGFRVARRAGARNFLVASPSKGKSRLPDLNRTQFLLQLVFRLKNSMSHLAEKMIQAIHAGCHAHGLAWAW